MNNDNIMTVFNKFAMKTAGRAKSNEERLKSVTKELLRKRRETIHEGRARHNIDHLET